MKNQHFDLVTVIKEVEDQNRIATVVMTDKEVEFLMEQARALPNGEWNGTERRQAVKALTMEEVRELVDAAEYAQSHIGMLRAEFRLPTECIALVKLETALAPFVK